MNLRAVLPLLLCASGCSLADLSGLSVGTGAGGGDDTTGAGSTGETQAASSGAIASSAASTGGDGGAASSASGSSSSEAAGGASSTGTGGAPPCPPGAMCEVVDDFDDGAVDGIWTQFGECDMGVQAGRAFIHAFDESTHYCGWGTSDLYDLQGQSIHIQVLETTTDQVGTQTYLAVEDPSGDVSIAISKSGSALQVENGPTTTHVIAADFDETEARFWRIAGDGDELVFSIHGDAVADAWVEVFRTSEGVPDLSEIRVVFGLGTYGTVVDAGDGFFDCVNVPPEDCL